MGAPSTGFDLQWPWGLSSEGPTAITAEHHHLPVLQQKAAACPTLLVAMLSSGKLVVMTGTGK